jgi:hypothetical protein
MEATFNDLKVSLGHLFTMLFTSPSRFLSTTLAICSTITASSLHRCKSGEPCWPSIQEWNTFNSSISGHLLATYPSASPCHSKHYDAALCKTVQQNWTNSFWRTSQPGAYSAVLWELGEDKCFINTTIDALCGQGRVAEYSVEAHGVGDIQSAVRFADKRFLYLVVKNTGHDHLGRSSGRGAFAVWTHNLKGREWHDSFVPKNAPHGTIGIPAVTLQAGEQWLGLCFFAQ